MNLPVGSPSPEEVQAAVAENIDRERFRLLLSASTPSTIMATVFAMVATLFFYQRIGQATIIAWLILKIGIALIRMWHQRQHAFAPRNQPAPSWIRHTGWLLMLDGTIWGAAGLAALWGHDSSTLMIAMSLAGIATMATFTLQAHWPYVVAYCLPMMLPAIAVTALQQDPFGLYVSTSLILFTACLLTVSRQSEKRMKELLRLRFINADLAQDREYALNLAQQQMVEKSQFLATMSHELRTPLHGMLGLTQLLQNSPLPDADLNRLKLISRSGEHLLQVVNNILDFTRIEAGHLETECRAFELRAVLTDVVALNTITAQNKHLGLHLDLQLPEPCWVMGDAARLRQILLNLISNAVKFTHHGEVRVTAQRNPTNSQEGEHIVIRVADTGIGIATQDIERIFTPFRRIDHAELHRFDGSGLGLTISRAMAHAMHGDITCVSRCGEGSTFELTLPLPPTEPQPTRETTTVADTGASPLALHGKVILAEDNEVNAMIVEALLRRHGLDVDHRSDGQAVIEAVCSGHIRPDLILMDCLMPALDGYEATRLIRADEQTRQLPRVPIVALTASALSEDHDRCLSAGMDGYLSKPFTEDQLIATLAAYLPAMRARLETRAPLPATC